MEKISPQLLAEIKAKVPITSIIGEHVVLRKSGANHTGLCPFHSERTPSFSVSESKGLFHCYGCKAGGDAVHFIMQLHGVGFVEAVRDLAARAGIPLQALDKEQLAQATDATKRKETAYRVNRFVAAYYRHNLNADPAALEYCRKRGVSDEVSEAFYVGTTSSAPLWAHLEKSKAPLSVAEQLGLIRKQNFGPGYMDLFRNRIIFPIIDTRGKVLGFGGRALDAESKTQPKYLNSTESPLFQKGKILYGLFQAAPFIREKDEVVVVEGYFDVLTLHARGFKNVVATCGTQLTEDHLKTLSRFATKVVLLFDSDHAGQAATLKAMETGLKLGMVLYSGTLEEGKDPDEVALADPGALERLIAAATPVLDSEIARWIERSKHGPELKSQAIKHIGAWLSIFSDPVGRQVRTEEVARALNTQMRGFVKGAPQANAKPRVQQTLDKLGVGDRALLKFYLGDLFRKSQKDSNPSEWASFSAQWPPKFRWTDVFEHPELRKFTRENAHFFESWESAKTFLNENDVEGQGQYLSEIRPIFSEISIEEKVFVPGKLEQVRALQKIWARFSQHLLIAIRQAEDKRDSERQSILLKDYLDVQKKMKDFNSFYDQV